MRLVAQNPDLRTNEGDVVTLTCLIEGERPVEVIWIRESTAVKASERVEMGSNEKESSHFLRLFDASRKDSGKYTCLALNPTGEKWTEFRLRVDRT